MTARVIEINYCSMCPNFDNKYFSYNERCILLGRRIEQIPKYSAEYPIPDDCPLEKVEE